MNDIFNEFLNSLAGNTYIGRYYRKWMTDNPNQAKTWAAAIDAIKAGLTPVTPVMGSDFGKMLISVAKLASPQQIFDFTIFTGQAVLSGTSSIAVKFTDHAPTKVELLNYDNGKVLAAVNGDGTQKSFNLAFDSKTLPNGQQHVAFRTPAGVSAPIPLSISN